MATRNSPPHQATTACLRLLLTVAIVCVTAVTASAQRYSSTFPADDRDTPTSRGSGQSSSEYAPRTYESRFNESRSRTWDPLNEAPSRNSGRIQQINTRRYESRQPSDDGVFPPLGNDDFERHETRRPVRVEDSYERLEREFDNRSREFDRGVRENRRPPMRPQFEEPQGGYQDAPEFDDRDVRSFEGRGSLEPADFRNDRRPAEGPRYHRRPQSPRSGEPADFPPVRDGRRDPRLPANPRPQQPAREQHPEDAIPETQRRQMKISARYGNPVIQRFVQGVPAQQAMRLYQESMQLIDTRHLQPSTYDARVREAVANLSQAIEMPAFQQANRVSLNPQQVRGVQTALAQVASSRPVQSQADAVGVLQSAMQVASQQAGIPPAAVVMEFVFGGTDSLDKYSTFMPEENAPKPSAAILDDHVVGIGVEIMPNEKGVTIKKCLPGGPAGEAGLQAGDVIVAVNGRPIQGQSMDYAVDLITGQPGTTVQLSVVRGNRAPGTVQMVRRSVKVASVSEAKIIDPQNGIGYIKLEKFAQASEQEVDQALWSLNQQGMKSLVFDLRGNPGGLLNVAIGLADKFLPSGTIVATRGRTQQDNTQEIAHKDRTWKTPMVVLVDGESASASEIFAAAIQDNGRGVVVGRKSYGKGTVQTHFPLQAVNGYLKLTTAKFYSPSGREMAGQGVVPDVEVAMTKKGNGIEANLANDADIAAAVRTIGDPRVQEMANNAGRNMTQPGIAR